jgi:hypothetical protein
LALPAILSRKPLVWIWDFPEDFPQPNSSIPIDYEGDVDLLPPDRSVERSGRLSENDQGIQTYFEESFVRQLSSQNPRMNMAIYEDHIYGRGQWLLRSLRFALNRFSDSQDIPRYNRFVDEWKRDRATFKNVSI